VLSLLSQHKPKSHLKIYFRDVVLLPPNPTSANVVKNTVAISAESKFLNLVENSGKTDQLTNARRNWSSSIFTDPAKHDPKKYVYLIHSLNNSFHWDKPEKAFGLPNDESELNLMLNPDFVSQLGFISATIISNEKPTTYGLGSGLILRVPIENIIATYPGDMRSDDIRLALEKDADTVASSLYKKFSLDGLLSPQQLLDETLPDFYNEVLLAGETSAGSTIEVIGYFTKNIDGHDMMKMMGNYAAIQSLSKEKSIPLIELESGPVNLKGFDRIPPSAQSL
jgi:hypothetical protein